MAIIVPFEAQLPQKYGPTLCTAVSCARSIVWATQGQQRPTGAQVRSKTNEPVPDPSSPGLNLPQVAAAAAKYGVYLDVRIGSRSIPWADYERYRIDGRGAIIQTGYGPIADSPQDAGNGFRGNHALFENNRSTYDSLADGRYPGVWEFDGRLYQRSLIKAAAARLVIGSSTNAPGGVVYPRQGTVWAAFTLDVVPDYHVQMPKGYPFWTYRVNSAGQITGRYAQTTPAGFGADCTAPVYHAWPNGPVAYKRLVKLTEGTRKGRYLEARFAEEV